MRAFVVFCILLACLPTVAASNIAALNADNLMARQASYEGPLGLFLDDVGGVQAGMDIHAERVHLELDRAEASVDTGTVRQNAGTSMAPTDHDNARITGSERSPDSRIVVSPIGQGAVIRYSPECIAAMPSGSDHTIVPYVRAARQSTLIEGSLLMLQGCSRQAPVIIQGDMQVSLWGINAVMTEGGKTTTIETGARPRPDIPGGLVEEATEAYLTLTNGTLIFHELHGELYGRGPASIDMADVRFNAVDGEVLGQAVQADAVDLQGVLHATLASQGDRIGATVGGQPASVAVNGATLQLPETESSFNWLWLASAAFVVAALLILQRNRITSRRLGRLWAQRRYHKVIRFATRSLDRKPNAHIFSLRGAAFLELNRESEAIQDFDQAQSLAAQETPEFRVANELAAAEACIRIGDLHQGARWWRLAFAEVPSLAYQALQSEPFRPLRGQLFDMDVA